jgi:VanZ family protein
MSEEFTFSRYLKKISLKCLIALTIAVLVVTLFFGLRPKGYRFSNDVSWRSKPPGIRFNGYGIVYTDPIKDFSMSGDMNNNGYSIEIAFIPESYYENGFNLLFTIHNGDDRKQLLIGQWRSWLIAMNGDDYDHSRKTKRITVKLTEASSMPRFATLTTGKTGTSIYMDGRLIRRHKDLTLNIPEGKNARLLLGNSVYGKNNWRGDVLGLAVYPHPLSEKEVANHFKHWLKNKSFLFARELKPVALWVFDENNGEKVMDRGGGNIDFNIPPKMKILTKKVLSFSWRRPRFNIEFFDDVVINLVGFIPLGFFLNATFSKVGSDFNRNGILVTIVLCFFVSLFIEVFQAWIPSRSSDVLDLALNTIGGLLGASVLQRMGRRAKSIGLSGKNKKVKG